MPDYPLPSGNPETLGFALKPLEHLDHLIREHIEEGRYPGAQIALARNGKLALYRTYGEAKTGGERVAATGDTLFLLFSQTKVLTSAGVWTLVEEGRASFMDKVADHLPEFAARGKGDITLHQVMTHQGGFPSGDVTQATWTDHARMRAEVCDFSLDWTPGSRLQYHPRAAHLTQAMVIEAMAGTPMHRGLGPHVRGESERIRGLGTLAAPQTFGHGGAGTSYSWADPTSGVSFTYLTNHMQPDPWHSARLDRIANLVHAAID